MSEKYRNTSLRARWWDYANNGFYFVTICTEGREYYLGNITGERMNLSKAGIIAKNFWKEIPMHFSYIELDEFVIMPDHLHGIIIINNPYPQ